jgi:hypothetical protein
MDAVAWIWLSIGALLGWWGRMLYDFIMEV